MNQTGNGKQIFNLKWVVHFAGFYDFWDSDLVCPIFVSPVFLGQEFGSRGEILENRI